MELLNIDDVKYDPSISVEYDVLGQNIFASEMNNDDLYDHIKYCDEIGIEIKYKDDKVPRLYKSDIGDWIDLCASEDVIIKRNCNALIDLGIAMHLPDNYEAYILPRSSTAIKWGCILLNSMGVIDNSYDGWWKANIYCIIPNQGDKITISNEDSKWFRYLAKHNSGRWIIKHFFKKMFYDHQYTLIKKGDRICQFRIIKNMPSVNFHEVESLKTTGSRGDKGFGSTGSN